MQNLKFNIGDYITIKKEYSWVNWYHTEPMCILSIDEYLDEPFEGSVYVTDCESNNSFANYIFESHKELKTYDTLLITEPYIELSKSHIRKDKLERILDV